LAQIEATARRHGTARVTVVRLKLGPLAHIDPDHLRAHFVTAARGTIVEDAQLDIQTTDELHELTLESLDLEVLETVNGNRPIPLAQDKAKANEI
jgi:hypothetical protein